jgi:hypothetical protein
VQDWPDPIVISQCQQHVLVGRPTLAALEGQLGGLPEQTIARPASR